MTERRILHADADAFFVAVARLVDPAGAGRAPLLIVGGRPGGRGVVCSASYETRAFGVRSAMPIARALRLCPDAMCVPVPAECREKSREIRRVLDRWTPVVEGASVDEWYLDLTGTEQLYGGESLEATARRIRDEVRTATGLSVTIGGGPSKLVAKLAAERAKPRADRPGATGVLVIGPEAATTFLASLWLAEFPGVGPKAQERLARNGLTTGADVLALGEGRLHAMLGPRAADWLLDRVTGRDDRPVASRESRKQMSRERTFPRDIADTSELRGELDALARHVAAALRRERLQARTITVKLRDADFRTRTASRTLAAPVESDRAVVEVARELFANLRRARRAPARLIGIAAGAFDQRGSGGAEQLPLFAPQEPTLLETERDRQLSRALDVVRERFGSAALKVGRAQRAPRR